MVFEHDGEKPYEFLWFSARAVCTSGVGGALLDPGRGLHHPHRLEAGRSPVPGAGAGAQRPLGTAAVVGPYKMRAGSP